MQTPIFLGPPVQSGIEHQGFGWRQPTNRFPMDQGGMGNPIQTDGPPQFQLAGNPPLGGQQPLGSGMQESQPNLAAMLQTFRTNHPNYQSFNPGQQIFGWRH